MNDNIHQPVIFEELQQIIFLETCRAKKWNIFRLAPLRLVNKEWRDFFWRGKYNMHIKPWIDALYWRKFLNFAPLLCSIEITNCGDAKHLLPFLRDCHQLRRLVLKNNSLPIKDVDLVMRDFLCDNHQLRTFCFIEQNWIFHQTSILPYLENCTNLRELQLGSSDYVTTICQHEKLSQLLFNPKCKLQSLQLSNLICSDELVTSICANAGLRSLEINSNSNETNNFLAKKLRENSGLRALKITVNKAHFPLEIIQALSVNTGLRRLHISGVDVEHLPIINLSLTKNKTLHNLILNGEKLDIDAVSQFIENLPDRKGLRFLHVESIYSNTRQALSFLDILSNNKYLLMVTLHAEKINKKAQCILRDVPRVYIM